MEDCVEGRFRIVRGRFGKMEGVFGKERGKGSLTCKELFRVKRNRRVKLSW